MTRKIIAIIIAASLIATVVAGCMMTKTDENMNTSNQVEATIKIEGNTIVYDGEITDDGVKQAQSLYSDSINKLVINSKNGDMKAGIALGEFVFDNELSVEVKDYAISAAANYVITAAKKLYLNENSVVGFNGGIAHLSKEDSGIESEYFSKIGVEQQITTLGQRQDFTEKLKDKDGFTYSLDALDKLGVKNVEIIGDEWKTNDKYFVINRDDFYSQAYLNYDTPDVTNDLSVYRDGNSIVYDGYISVLGLQKVRDLYTDDVDRIVLNSGGGEINVGMDFGDFIHEKGLDVEVRNLAFSSAANYLITAAKTLYLHENSVIGWHGGATQEDDNPETKEGGEWYEYHIDSIKRETAFYEKIGVDQKITVYGQNGDYDEIANELMAIGWTYDLDTLRKMGVENIELIDGEWAPNTKLQFGEQALNLFVVDDIDIN